MQGHEIPPGYALVRLSDLATLVPEPRSDFPRHRTRLPRQERFRDPQENDRSVRRTRPSDRREIPGSGVSP
jgi:hypothetical protein